MGLLDILRTGVAIADSVTKDIQAYVMYTKSAGADFEGNPTTPGAAISLRAIVDWKQQQVRTQGGELTVTRATVLFLDVDALIAATNGEGIGDEDIIVLPDGTTGPILDMGGFIDAGTGHPLATEVFLG